MPQQQLTAMLVRLEQACTEAQAVAALHEVLLVVQDFPVTWGQRARLNKAASRLLQRGLLPAEHALVKCLSLRLSMHYVPAICDLRVPAALPPPLPAISRGTSPVVALSPPPTSHAPCTSTTLSHDYLLQPLPPGAKMLCVVTRQTSKFKPQQQPAYRLFLEQVVGTDEEACQAIRKQLEASQTPLDPRMVAVEDKDGGAVAAPASLAALLANPSRCVLEAKRQKGASLASLSKGQFQVTACADKSSQGEDPSYPVVVGTFQSPSAGVLTAQAADKGMLVGSRLCAHVIETRERLLTLGVVLPAATKANVDLQHAPEILEGPLAHLQALYCSVPSSFSLSTTSTAPSSGASSAASSPASPPALRHVLGLRNKPARWSPACGYHTLEFDNNGARVKEPSRKNLGLMDVTQVAAARDYASMAAQGSIRRGGSSSAAEDAVDRRPKLLLQLGKVGEHAFSLDFRAPLSPFQALAVAVAAFEA